MSDTTITLPANQYWELRTRILEHQKLIEQERTSKAAVDALVKAAGLDPNKSYNLDDATLTATLVVPTVS